MDNGIYIALARQTALFRDMDVTANNIANQNTNGYKSSHVLFESYLMKDATNKMAFSNDVSTYTNTSSGSISSTGNDFDLAISGDGYFAVDTPLGERYTRGGSFVLDKDGVLTTVEGHAVLDTNGQRITFTADDRDIRVGELGNISVNGEERATLKVVTFDNLQKVFPTGNRLFRTEEEPQTAADARVLQGTLENSNVEPLIEMTHVIDISRQTGHTARYIDTMYELQRKHINTWTQQSA